MKNRETIFITGATGYIGERLALYLADCGNIVHALVRCPESKQRLHHRNIKIFCGDLSDQKSIERAIMSCEQVYHIAAFARLWHPDPGICDRVNVEGTNNVIMAARNTTSVKKIVFTSTAGVLGAAKNGELIDERVRNAGGLMTEYERSKARAEALVQTYVRNGMHIVIVNPTRVYGPGLRTQSNAVTGLIDKYLKGMPLVMPGAGTYVTNWAYVDDVVRGHIQAMRYGQPGERYILGGDNASYEELFELIRRLSGKYRPIVALPEFVIMAIARLSDLWTHMTGRAPLITRTYARKLLCNCPMDTSKAKNALKYDHTPLSEGIARTISWLRKNSEQ